jgi:hypothetical protein
VAGTAHRSTPRTLVTSMREGRVKPEPHPRI